MFFLLLLNILVKFFYGAILGGVLWHKLPSFSFPLRRICGNDFVVFCLWPNKIACLMLWIFFFRFHWKFCLPLYCPLPPVLVVVGETFLLGTFSCMYLSDSFQIILPILLPWLMPWHFSLYWILHAMVHFMGALLVSVCCIFVLGKNIHLLCFMPLVLICRIHPNICGYLFQFFFIMFLCLDVSRYNLKNMLFALRFLFLDFSVLMAVQKNPKNETAKQITYF